MNNKTVIALGFFDGLHIGHAALLNATKAAAAACGAEPAVLTFDIHPDTFVKHTPVELINSASDRGYIVRRFFGIEKLFYIHFNEETMRLPWQDFMEDITAQYHAVHFVIGHDFSCGFRGEGTAEKISAWCASRAIGCDVIPPVMRAGAIVSSTAVRELLRNGEVDRAAELLGHPHLLTDTVKTGFRLGRTMDFPTINMRLEENVLVPKRGVYASRVLLGEELHLAVTNIGMRPTFDGQCITVETHILDYSADLYGQRVCVEFCKFLRAERRFESPEALSAQIRADVAAARAYFANV